MNGSLAGPRARSTSSTSRPVWTMDAAERLKSQDSVKSMNEVRPKRSYLSAAVALLLYGFSFGIAIPAFPAITLGICDGDSALSARYYGIGMFIRYSVEFVASPVAGTMADVIGRKPIFLFCFLCISIEYFTLAVTPDLFTLFICRAVAGLGDSGLSTAYAIVSDIAAFNDDEITSKFGQLTAIIAVSFLCGPLIGGVLADINPRLCLGISGIVSTIALLVVMCTLEETLDLSSTKDAPPRIIYLRKRLHQKKSEPLSQAGRQGVQDARSDEDPTASSITGGGGYDNEKGLVDTREPGRAARSASSSSGGFSNIDNVGLVELNNTCGCCVPICPRGCATNLTLAWWVTLFTASNPLPAIMQHVSKTKVRDLMIVLLILNFSGGISAVFYLYMDYRFHASSLDIGLLLALVGLGSMIASACTGFIIPRFVTEKQAVLAGLVLDGLRLVWFGLAPSFEYLYIMVILCFSALSDIALKGLIVKADVEYDVDPNTAHQGSLQGVLGSIRCLASAVSSLVFAGIFSWSIKTTPPCAYIVFVIGAGLQGVALIYMLVIFSSRRWKSKGDDVGDSDDVPIYEKLHTADMDDEEA